MVNSEGIRNPEGGAWLQDGEAGASPEHMRIRKALLSLPRLNCPVGFEFRLQRRLSGASSKQTVRSGWNWALGWTGTGLGVATVMLLAVFVFDFHLTKGIPGTVTGTSLQASESTGQPVESTDRMYLNGSETLASSSESEQELNKQDSVSAPRKGELPEGHYHMVGGSE